LIIATALETEANVATTSELDRLSRQFGDGIDIQIERGWIERDAKGQVIEHFGFRDGISQPLFLKYEIDDYWASISGSPVRYDPSADPRSLILVPEAPITDSFGSFFVYRKLEQDVDGFRRACLQLAASLKKTEKDSGALVVGRQESGRPLIFDSSTSQDNFGYEIDPAGRACPLQSHIRKSNTRLALDVEARIARRGVSYGKKGVDGSVGLLFFCHVADITRQYEKIQGTWINNRSASERPSILCGPDALVATSDFSLANEHKWPINETDPASDIRFPFGKNVTVRGGEYFYTPSVKMLKVIASA
jgi:Dyp-type peroxidase family